MINSIIEKIKQLEKHQIKCDLLKKKFSFAETFFSILELQHKLIFTKELLL